MYHSIRHHVVAIAIALTATTACYSQADFVGDTRQASVCPEDECGGNAATAGHLRIGEVHIDTNTNTGLENTWGVKLIDFKAPNNAPGYSIRVNRGSFIARRGQTRLAGQDLIGSQLRFQDAEGNISAVDIIDVDTVQSWTASNYTIKRYKLALHLLADDSHTSICEDAVDLDNDAAWAVLISGERYDWPGKAVSATGAQASGWFNIACSGNGLYKVKLMGYDARPPQTSSYSTTADERQAALKMLTADYCGSGTSFTETGWPLTWHNTDGWSYNSDSDSDPLEALWDADGVVCLDAPRLGADEWASIQAACEAVDKVLISCDQLPPPTVSVWSSRNPQ